MYVGGFTLVCHMRAVVPHAHVLWHGGRAQRVVATQLNRAPKACVAPPVHRADVAVTSRRPPAPTRGINEQARAQQPEQYVNFGPLRDAYWRLCFHVYRTLAGLAKCAPIRRPSDQPYARHSRITWRRACIATDTHEHVVV